MSLIRLRRHLAAKEIEKVKAMVEGFDFHIIFQKKKIISIKTFFVGLNTKYYLEITILNILRKFTLDCPMTKRVDHPISLMYCSSMLIFIILKRNQVGR